MAREIVYVLEGVQVIDYQLRELELLLRFHDGDDRCRCLASSLYCLAQGYETGVAIEILYECLEGHPAGSSAVRFGDPIRRSDSDSHVRTYVRTNGEGGQEIPDNDALVTRTRKAAPGTKKKGDPNG